MPKKRILYIESNKDGTIGGSYYSLLYLIQNLNKNKYEPYVLFCEPNILISNFKEYAKNVIVYDYKPSGSTSAISLKFIPRFFKHILIKQIYLQKLIKKIKPDIIHLNNGYANNHEWIFSCILNKIKIVTHDRGTRPPATLQTKLFVRFIDTIIPVSEAFKKNIIDQKLKPKKIARVYNGLDVTSFKKYCSTEDRYLIRQEINIDTDATLIGMIGNINKWKGQLVFAKAIKSLITEHFNHNIKAIIVGATTNGSEYYEKQLHDYIQTNELHDILTVVGFRKDIPQILNAIDIFVHSSTEPETFSRVILEAMALAKPIIATNSGGTTEQIVDGESGLLVPMNDEVSMATAIKQFLNQMHKANDMGKNAYLRLKNNFSIQNMVEGIEKVYYDISKN